MDSKPSLTSIFPVTIVPALDYYIPMAKCFERGETDTPPHITAQTLICAKDEIESLRQKLSTAETHLANLINGREAVRQKEVDEGALHDTRNPNVLRRMRGW